MEEFLKSIPYNLLITLSTGILVFVVLYKFFPKLFIKIHKPIFFSIGILSLSLGYVGIVVPGLPTTVFIYWLGLMKCLKLKQFVSLEKKQQ